MTSHGFHASMVGSYPNVAPLKAAPQKVWPRRWSRSERSLFNGIKSCYRTEPPPPDFLVAVRDFDVEQVVTNVQQFVDSDIPMTSRLRRRANRWLDAHR